MNQQQFVEGMPVFDSAGEKVGTVSEHNPQAGYLTVQKGLLFPKDLYVPLNEVERTDADGIYLSIHKGDLSGDRYENPPATGSMDSSYAQPGGIDAMGTTGAVRDDLRTDTYQTRGTTDTDDVRVPVMEEELQVGKREEEIGRVHLHKDVVEEQQTASAPITREEVHVERVPVQGEYANPGADAFTEKDIDVPVMGEELVAGKRAVVTEEVRLHKEAVTEEQQVSDTVRKERVTVEGADDVRGSDAELGMRDRDAGTAYNRNS